MLLTGMHLLAVPLKVQCEPVLRTYIRLLSGFLSGAPTPVATGNPWTVQTFDFDGDVEITANRGDESITLDYDDHSDIATISVDRNDVPAGGQVHITISDFQLNLDPTADDAWTLNADGMQIQQRS